MLEVKVTGFEELAKKLATYGAGARKAGLEAVYQEAKQIAYEAVELCPKEFGVLRGSIWAQRNTGSGDEIAATVHAGGGEPEEYAVAVHEHPSAMSPPSWQGKTITWTYPGTGAKFVERPMLKWASNGAEHLSKRLDVNAMGRG